MNNLLIKQLKLYFKNLLFLFLINLLNLSNSFAENAKLKITEIKINDIDFSDPFKHFGSEFRYSKLNKDGIPQDLVLDVIQPSSLKIKFVYTGKAKPQFRHKLKGYDNNWHWIDSGQILKYKDVKHGRYTLIIQAIQKKKILKEVRLGFYNNMSTIWIYLDLINLAFLTLLIYGIIKMK
jgi:hypothetical protein